MQQMVTRYRDRLANSSSQVKALSASRQKSLTNQSIINVLNIQSSESLKKSRQKLSLVSENKRVTLQQEQEKTKCHTKQLNRTKNLLLSNTSNMSLPPQPHLSSTNMKQKQKSQKIANSILSSAGNQLKSSRRADEKISHQKQESSRLTQKQKSKSKKVSSKTPKKQVIFTHVTLNESFSEAIYDVLVSDLTEKNLSINFVSLINKEQLKQKLKLLLEQYFTKKLQLHQREIFTNGVESQGVNMKMAHSYVIQQQQSAYHNEGAIQPSSNAQLPSSLSKTQLSVQKSFTNELQKRFFQAQKQRQYLSIKVQSLTIKLESLTKQLQKSSKIQKLMNSVVESQNDSRRQVTRLRRELQVSELKNSEQQKLWRKQTLEMRDLMDELRGQLIKKYVNPKIKSKREQSDQEEQN